MSGAKTKGRLTYEDLKWFNIKDYAGARDLPLADWVSLLEVRVLISSSLEAEGEFGPDPIGRALLRMTIVDPLEPPRSNDPTDACVCAGDTASVRSLRLRDCTYATGISLVHKLDLGTLFDEVSASENPDVHLAHLQVNLDASPRQILADFQTWLDLTYQRLGRQTANRDYRERIRAWADGKFLPYFDLRLVEASLGKRIPPGLMCTLLDIDQGSSPSDMLKAAEVNRKSVFTKATVRAMRLQVSQETMSAVRSAAGGKVPPREVNGD